MATIGPATLDALAEGFAAAHQRMYGFVAEDEPVQLVTFRVEAAGVVPKASFQPQPDAGPDASARDHRRGARSGCRKPVVRRPARSTTATGCDRGNRIAGPAIVEQMDATTLCCPA